MSFLVLKGIQKRFPGGTVAVEDFNLAAEKGELGMAAIELIVRTFDPAGRMARGALFGEPAP